MKRSQINSAIKKAKERLKEFKITLPEFGYWSCREWEANKEKIARIKERMLGWDVTDFGRGDFNKCGAVLFTVRNGDKKDLTHKAPYAEKYIMLDDSTDQEIPLHYHIEKTEDIINRGGGILCVELYHKSSDGGLDKESNVCVWQDAMEHTYAPGEIIEITPGNSITLEPFVYHRFFAKKGEGMLIVGEVSKVNDDKNDNVFSVESNYFCDIEEDEAPIHPLVSEY